MNILENPKHSLFVIDTNNVEIFFLNNLYNVLNMPEVKPRQLYEECIRQIHDFMSPNVKAILNSLDSYPHFNYFIGGDVISNNIEIKERMKKVFMEMVMMFYFKYQELNFFTYGSFNFIIEKINNGSIVLRRV